MGAKVQRFLTASDFDHVGMIIKLQKKDLMVFEANQMHGVAIYDWKQYITYFNLYEQVTLRKLHYIRKPEAQNTLLQFVKKQLGKKY
jgi:Cys-tRNA synthase (O-phospho-L-seryl-tRNA:Cys-tRNA synthase)